MDSLVWWMMTRTRRRETTPTQLTGYVRSIFIAWTRIEAMGVARKANLIGDDGHSAVVRPREWRDGHVAVVDQLNGPAAFVANPHEDDPRRVARRQLLVGLVPAHQADLHAEQPEKRKNLLITARVGAILGFFKKEQKSARRAGEVKKTSKLHDQHWVLMKCASTKSVEDSCRRGWLIYTQRSHVTSRFFSNRITRIFSR